uniref:Uncharacterized protein n=1 Tax=Oryza sativa subsp. japonica TaxID=39947 RepID=Q651I5_ORYSJ|nr:hypothetical protein [Oryza sativa Japonica Group]
MAASVACTRWLSSARTVGRRRIRYRDSDDDMLFSKSLQYKRELNYTDLMAALISIRMTIKWRRIDINIGDKSIRRC